MISMNWHDDNAGYSKYADCLFAYILHAPGSCNRSPESVIFFSQQAVSIGVMEGEEASLCTVSGTHR